MSTVTIHPAAKKLAVIMVVVAVVATLVGAFMTMVAAPTLAQLLCNSNSLEAMADREKDAGNAEYLRQEAKACREAEARVATPSSKPTATATSTTGTPSASATTSVPATDETAPAPTTTVPDEATKGKDLSLIDDWPRYERELVATRPAAEKLSLNSYGPDHALHPDFRGKPLESLTPSQFFAELKYRMPMSPVLTASTGAALGMWPESTINDRIHEYLEDSDKWRADVKRVSDRLDKELKNARKRTFGPGKYDISYQVTDKDGVPHYGADFMRVRDNSFTAIALKDGTVLRMECGGQLYGVQERPIAKSAPAMPKPSKGMDRDEEGNPVVLVNACRKVNGVWRDVFNVKPQQGDLKPGAEECTPSTTPTPGKTTSTTPPPTTTTPPTTPPTTSTPSTSLNPKDPSQDGGDSGQNENTGPGEYVPPSEATESHSPPATYNPPPATHEPTTAPPVVVNPDPTPTRTSDPTDTSTGVVPVPTTTLPGGF